jgi:ribose 1,5-bisphosphokinase PhnN
MPLARMLWIMNGSPRVCHGFAEAVRSVVVWSSQVELIAVLSRRLAERGRERVAAAVAQARREFAAGQCQPMTAAEMVREAQS